MLLTTEQHVRSRQGAEASVVSVRTGTIRLLYANYTIDTFLTATF